MKMSYHRSSDSLSVTLVPSSCRVLVNTMTATATVASTLLPLLLMPLTTMGATSETCSSSPTPPPSCRAAATAGTAHHSSHTILTRCAFIASRNHPILYLGKRWQSQQHGDGSRRACRHDCTRVGFTLPRKRHHHLAACRRGTMFAAAGAGSEGEQESAGGVGIKGGVTGVYDESWYLGDGGFAGRHVQDEDRIEAREEEKDFFRKRSLSVYDQMREASMLLLAQQQILAAEEAREESSKPRFVAAAGGTQAARAQAARERNKKRAENARLSAQPTAAAEKAEGSEAQLRGGNGGQGVMLPAGANILSGETLGVGGLDEEIEEIRRRICVPLAAPADLLEDLGISPVRGLLLYGPPGCGKTLLARRLSAELTRRPPAVVSGPEILERFVGSSEANVRALFDYPPDVPGGDEAEQQSELHVIVMDEFDSIGQSRGGGGDDGGDRVRDSVVNQLLARMDGFQELERPTLLVALTNRIDLLDSALLRPGRFEVQIMIPGPDFAGREEILRIHTQRMHKAGRIETPPMDAPTSPSMPATVASSNGQAGYEALVSSLASVTDGFTGAELAGVVRAAASYALERAVGVAAKGSSGGNVAEECRVTAEDFGRGLSDVLRSKSSVERPARREMGTSTARTFDWEGVADGAMAAVGGGQGLGVVGLHEAASDASGPAADIGDVAKSTAAAAAAVAAARLESDIGGNLSRQDLVAVQKLLLQKTSERAGEDAMLFDAAQVVAQRRKRGRGGKGEVAGTQDGDENGEGQEDSADSIKGPRKLKKFANTGWFHTYE